MTPAKITLSCLLALMMAVASLRAGVQADGEFAAVENDIGTIGSESEAAQPKPEFHASVQGQTEFRTNAALQGATGGGDVLYMPRVQLGYTIPLSHGLSIDLAASVDGVFYSRLTENNFIAYGASAFLDYRHRPDAPRLYVGVEPYYFQGFDGDGLISEAIGVRAGFDHGIPLNRNRTLLFYGLEYGSFFANPDIDTRLQVRATAGIMQQITPVFFAQAFYSYQFSSYYVMDRFDSRNIVSLSLIYQFTPRFSGTLKGDFVSNHSDLSDFSYLSTGVGVLFAYQF